MGQLLERPVLIPRPTPGGRPVCLDGIYLRGAGPGLVVIPPLAGHGGSMHSPVLNELAYAAAYGGQASLRFDFRGVGASEGEPSDDRALALSDAAAAAEFLQESTGEQGVAVAGYGSGAWIALALAAQLPVTRVLLVSPLETPSEITRVEVPVLLVQASGELGDVAVQRPLADLLEPLEPLREVIDAESRALREGLGHLARITRRFLGAQPAP
ncbi:MAG: alpha/beta fold hydrolase [Planctomycetes bacterium]|nr:alpha/beta fold hydrolase [Planctomycetota bacterium]